MAPFLVEASVRAAPIPPAEQQLMRSVFRVDAIWKANSEKTAEWRATRDELIGIISLQIWADNKENLSLETAKRKY